MRGDWSRGGGSGKWGGGGAPQGGTWARGRKRSWDGGPGGRNSSRSLSPKLGRRPLRGGPSSSGRSWSRGRLMMSRERRSCSRDRFSPGRRQAPRFKGANKGGGKDRAPPQSRGDLGRKGGGKEDRRYDRSSSNDPGGRTLVKLTPAIGNKGSGRREEDEGYLNRRRADAGEGGRPGEREPYHFQMQSQKAKERLTKRLEDWYLAVQLLMDYDDRKTYTADDMEKKLMTFLETERKEQRIESRVTSEIFLRGILRTLWDIDRLLRELNPGEDLARYAKSPVVLSILRVMGYELMWMADGSAKAASRSAGELMEKCNLPLRDEREWISGAISRMCNSFEKSHEEFDSKRREKEKNKREQARNKTDANAIARKRKSAPNGDVAKRNKANGPSAVAAELGEDGADGEDDDEEDPAKESKAGDQKEGADGEHKDEDAGESEGEGSDEAECEEADEAGNIDNTQDPEMAVDANEEEGEEEDADAEEEEQEDDAGDDEAKEGDIECEVEDEAEQDCEEAEEEDTAGEGEEAEEEADGEEGEDEEEADKAAAPSRGEPEAKDVAAEGEGQADGPASAGEDEAEGNCGDMATEIAKDVVDVVEDDDEVEVVGAS